jgi:hypothetical protein
VRLPPSAAPSGPDPNDDLGDRAYWYTFSFRVQPVTEVGGVVTPPISAEEQAGRHGHLGAVASEVQP